VTLRWRKRHEVAIRRQEVSELCGERLVDETVVHLVLATPKLDQRDAGDDLRTQQPLRIVPC
jgi:hypothetical protein